MRPLPQSVLDGQCLNSSVFGQVNNGCLWFSCAMASDRRWCLYLVSPQYLWLYTFLMWCFTEVVEDPYTNRTYIWNLERHQNIGIKHGFSCINIRQVPREVLKTEAGGRGFQCLPRDLANVNALKIHVLSLLLHKKWKHLLHLALFHALCCFAFSPISRT